MTTHLSATDRRALSKKLVAAGPPLRKMGADDALAAAAALKKALGAPGPVSRADVAPLLEAFEREMAKIFRGARSTVEAGEVPTWASAPRGVGARDDDDGADDAEPE